MSDKVEVPFGDSATDTAVLLLAAAEELELDATVVETTSFSSFMVPEEVAKKASEPEKKAPAKKAAAKKSAK